MYSIDCGTSKQLKPEVLLLYNTLLTLLLLFLSFIQTYVTFIELCSTGALIYFQMNLGALKR